MDTKANKLAADLLMAVKMESPTEQFKTALKAYALAKLELELDNDDKKKAFWINIYNAYYQILRLENKITKPEIYKSRLITIAGKKISLDNIEHGILRRFRYKYALGFLANYFSARWIKRLAVDTIDYRIHFALNCGAKSCPPIAFYSVAKINQQLDMATQNFLTNETEYDHPQKVVHTTTLFKWFLADFGGIKGIKQIFKKQIEKDISDYTIKFKPYSWEDDLNNFI